MGDVREDADEGVAVVGWVVAAEDVVTVVVEDGAKRGVFVAIVVGVASMGDCKLQRQGCVRVGASDDGGERGRRGTSLVSERRGEEEMLRGGGIWAGGHAEITGGDFRDEDGCGFVGGGGMFDCSVGRRREYASELRSELCGWPHLTEVGDGNDGRGGVVDGGGEGRGRERFKQTVGNDRSCGTVVWRGQAGAEDVAEGWGGGVGRWFRAG